MKKEIKCSHFCERKVVAAIYETLQNIRGTFAKYNTWQSTWADLANNSYQKYIQRFVSQ